MSFYLWGSPFFWLTIPFEERLVPYLLPFVMSLRYGTAMVTSYAWIRRQVRSDLWAALGSFLYAFSGFQACNIVFQHFHDATAFFPLYLLTFDDIVQKRKTTGFTLMTALMSIINYYFFFGQAVFILISPENVYDAVDGEQIGMVLIDIDVFKRRAAKEHAAFVMLYARRDVDAGQARAVFKC